MTTYTEAFAEAFPSTNIEQDYDIPAAIYRAYENGDIKPLTIRVRGTGERKPRTYIGASRIGHECERAVWLEYRGLNSEDFEGRMLRLFSRGDIGEERMRHELECIGFECGGDQSKMQALNGRFGGHTDGFVRLPGMPWLLLECKTAGSKSFAKYKKYIKENKEDPSRPHGVEAWKPLYWSQIHVYMAAFGLDQCLYMVADKNDETLIVQLIDYREDVAREAYARAKRVIDAPMPERPFGAPKKPTCMGWNENANNWCAACDFCWEDEPLPRKCGSCKHWRSLDEWGGECGIDCRRVTQHDCCEAHEPIDAPDEDAVFIWSD